LLSAKSANFSQLVLQIFAQSRKVFIEVELAINHQAC